MKKTTGRIKKILYITGGTISLALGVLGVFLPVLPTTPFLLLTAFCYVRSSKRLYTWLINHKLFGSYIYNYMKYKAVKKRVKTGAVIFLWITIGVSILAVNNLHIRIFLVVVAIAVSWHILSLKSLESFIQDEQAVKKGINDLQ
jgi:uncharacterized membrane protein YbaN (DUF454 family)